MIQSVDTAMEHDLYNRNLPPDDSVFASEEFFLIAASELLNKNYRLKNLKILMIKSTLKYFMKLLRTWN